MPEYALTFQDQHCHDHWTTLRIWGRLFIPLFAAMAAGAGFLYTVYSVRLGGFELEDEENAPFFNQLDRSAKERYGIRRSFLGMGKEDV